MKRLRTTRGLALVRAKRAKYLAALTAIAACLVVYAVPAASATHRARHGSKDAKTSTTADPTRIAFRKSPPAIFSCMTGVLDNTGTAGMSNAVIGPGAFGTVRAEVNLIHAVPNTLYLIELVQTNGIACVKLQFTFVTTDALGNATTVVDDIRLTTRAFVFASGGGDLEITPAVSSVL